MLRKKFSVNVEIMEAKNCGGRGEETMIRYVLMDEGVCEKVGRGGKTTGRTILQVSIWFQKDAPSSRENSTPPV